MWAMILVAATTAEIPLGSHHTTEHLDGCELELYTYKPTTYRDGPLILVFHGVLRNAEEYRDHARSMGERFGALIVAPRFTEEQFPLAKYQLGGLKIEGQVRPKNEWTWRLVPEIAENVRARERRPEMPYYLIGHSGGGQFVMRLAGFTLPGAAGIVASNSGTVLFPNKDHDFPYGFGGLPDELSDDECLKRYLSQPLTLFLGSGDTERDEYLDVSPAADRQGACRFERNQALFRAARQTAIERGWKFGWRLVVAEGIEHDHQKMFDHETCREAILGRREAILGR